MLGALIVIEVAAAKVSDEALSALVSACSRAARDAECVLARNASDEQPAAVAIVTLQSEDKLRVEVGVRRGDHDSWRTKDFAFLAADENLDRWRAVGFAIGTLAENSPAPEEETSALVAPPAPEPPPRPPSAPVLVRPVAPAPSLSSDQRRSSGTQLFVGAAAIFGPGLETDPPWRLGSKLYADLVPAEAPVFLTVGASAATRLEAGASGVRTRWFDVSLGVGAPLLGHMQGSGLESRAQLLTEYFDARASALGRSQTDHRWTLGLQGAFGGRLQIVPNLFVTAELEAALLSGDTEVLAGGESVGRSGKFRYLGSVGLRVRLR